MKKSNSGFFAILTSIGAPVLGSTGGACGVACIAGGCCGGPAIFALLGLSGTTLSFIEKLTPVFLVITVISLSYGFYKAYKPKPAACCEPDGDGKANACCAKPVRVSFTQSKSFLWIIALLCAVMWTYPYLAGTLTGSTAVGQQQSSLPAMQQDSTAAGNGISSKAAVDGEACCPKKSDCSTGCE